MIVEWGREISELGFVGWVDFTGGTFYVEEVAYVEVWVREFS